MALHARAVLYDCEQAFIELRAANQENLRRRWLTMLTLLRSVGYVLKKIDSRTSDAHRFVIHKKWDEANAGKSRCEPPILWGFIEQERNNVLKQYEFGVRGSLIIEISSPPAPIPVGTNYDIEPKFDVWPLIAGRFAGEQPFVVVQQAIEYWREYLDDVEQAVG